MPEQNIQPKTRTEFFLNRIARAVAGDAGWDAASGGTLVINRTATMLPNPDGQLGLMTELVLDKTWKEIAEALSVGAYCCMLDVRYSGDSGELSDVTQTCVTGVAHNNNGYYVIIDDQDYSCDSADGYPSRTQVTTPVVPGGNIDI